MPLWNELEGTRVADKFPLKQLMRSEGRTAWFATEDASGQPAVISLFESLNDEEAVLARMEAAARIRHPSLLSIRHTGSFQTADGPIVYAVMEPFEETLGDVLRERALSPEETGEIVTTLMGALEAVHGAGMMHGHVEPASVLAAGDQIKLRSDCLRQKATSERGANGETADVRGLAGTVYEALTQRKPVASAERDAARLPAPYGSLVRTGLSGNVRLADLRRVLQGPAVETATGAKVGGRETVPAAPPREERPAREERAEKARELAPELASGVAPGVTRSRLQDELDTEEKKKHPGVTVAALVIMALVLVLCWWFFRHRPGPTTPTGHQSSAAAASQTLASEQAPPPPPASTPSAATRGQESHVSKPNEAVSESMGAPGATPAAPVAAKPAPATTAESGDPRAVWHVIVYTFNREDQAQYRAQALAARHPELQPQVFSPTGGAPYLVALGPGMSRKDAYLLRNKARGAGLPQDTYMQNYSR
jgi:hypothetical protein